MDRDLLTGYLEAGLSLIEIGNLENRDPSTVGYWVKKHGLVANGQAKYAPRGGLTREQLEPLVESGATLQEMADVLDRSASTVRHWMAKHGLDLARARRHRAVFRDADRRGLTRVEAECRRHGPVEFMLRPDGGWRCNKCRSEDVSNWRRRGKQRLVNAAGGSCRICGYSRCVRALHFHHRDRKEKRFTISRRGRTRNFAELLEEAKKCVLLCANCHSEVHEGVTQLPPIPCEEESDPE